jgi:hypothetical protein
MRHFIAYHNTNKMGYPLPDCEPQRLLTSDKSPRRLLQNTVWIVTYEGTGAHQYCLGSVFQVDKVRAAGENGFKWCASGPGHVFRPWAPIKNMNWFPELLRVTGRFCFIGEIKDSAAIAGLTGLAQQRGYKLS